MIDPKSVNYNELKKNIAALNATEVAEPIKIGNTSKAELITSFTDTVLALATENDEEKLAKIPEEVANFYNSLVDDDDAGNDAGDDSGKTSGKSSGTKGGPHATAARSCYGQLASAMSGKLDEAFAKGGTIQEIMDSTGATRPRVTSHKKYLCEVCGLTLIEKKPEEGGKSADTYWEIKEKTYTKPSKK